MSRTKLPSHRVRGPILLALGTLSTLLMMCNGGQLPHGPLWGLCTMLLAVAGLLDTFGILLPGADVLDAATPLRRTAFGPRDGEPVVLAPMVTAPASIAILAIGGVALGFPGLHYAIGLALVPLALSALRRPGLLVFVIGAGLLLPFLGSYSLWDPWETHYGEVSREILSRDDWISLWWAQENWFWSKPILIFWSEALSMGMLGTPFRPDANPLHPEWALRLPIFLMSITALMAVFFAVRRVFSARAGVLAAIVLATMPHFFFLAHQAITDMPFVANMTTAVSLLVLALAQDPERTVGDVRIGPFVLSARHAVLGGLFVLAVPQALYLASRNVTWLEGGFAWHGDGFMFGSAGNAGVPGNAALDDVEPHLAGFAAQPISQALVWTAGLALILFFLRRERRAQALQMVGFYVFAALAFMGKGIPGFALPGAIALLYLVASRRWSVLLEGRLRIGLGALIVAVVGLPWYVAMYVRHGPGFTDRLLVHDHLNRLASGVHGDTGSVEYFIEQLGVSMFPWVGLVPAAIVLFVWYERRSAAAGAPSVEPTPAPEPGEDGLAAFHRKQTLVLLAVWFTAAFVLFSAMITKFHHYIFPAVPPAAILVGILFDRMLGDDPPSVPWWKRTTATVLAAIAPVFAVLGVAGRWGDVRGVVPAEVEHRTDWVVAHPWGGGVTLALIGLGVLLAAGAWWLTRPKKDEVAPSALGAALAIVGAAAAVVVAFVGRDLSWATDGRPVGYERLIHLFVYNYGRPWPDYLDYRPILAGFSIVAGVLLAALVFARVRPIAARAFVGLAIAWAAWTLDVYMVDLSPHWGQKELVARYYEERGGPDEPLVAWQMNWKGENFYSGNHVNVFVDLDNAKLREWLREHRGTRVFFLLEHGRLGGLRGLVPGREVREITTTRDCNKFILVETTL